MALFFDAAWFNEKLSARGLSRAAMASVAGLSEPELAEVFKDQRELSAGQVAAFAELLGVTPAEVADHAGVSTPTPSATAAAQATMDDIAGRIAALEAEIARLKAGG